MSETRSTPRPAASLCPTCNLGWWLNPPVRCADENRFRCIECKAIYTGEMLAARDMLAALMASEEFHNPNAAEMRRAAIAKATGKTP